MFKNGTQATVTVTGSTGAFFYTFIPKNTTDIIPAVGAGIKIMVVDNDKAENATFGQGNTPRFVKYPR